MKTILAGLGSLVLGLSLSGRALAQEAMPPQPYAAQGQPIQPGPGLEQGAPAPTPSVYEYATGHWVYTPGGAPLWVPAGATTVAVGGVPSAYRYTPSYGWAWSVSPWGWGGYRYGAWAGRPWRGPGWYGGRVGYPHAVHGGGYGRGGYGHIGYGRGGYGHGGHHR